jgi:hypothetical protein
MKTDALAAALKADILRPSTPAPSSSIDCFLCGRSFTYREPKGDENTRFCSDRCREAYDAGLRASEQVNPFKVAKWRVLAGSDPGYLQSTPMRRGSVGFYITCPGCQREFESKGLRCCSTDCERAAREHQENVALMIEVGMEARIKRICAKPGCHAPIPKWRKGRRVSARARFCDRHSPPFPEKLAPKGRKSV